MSTLLYKQMRIQKKNFRVATATAKHSLLLENEADILTNRISEKSHLNKYIFQGVDVSSSEEKRKEIFKYIEDLIVPSSENVAFDNQRFSNLKHKIKKWIDGAKTTEPEKELFSKILNDIEKKKSINVDFEEFSKDLKISRFNDKKKCIDEISKMAEIWAGNKIDSSKGQEIKITEILFKIPEHNEVELKGEEQQKIVENYYQENFPDFEIFLTCIHKDESKEHIHAFIDCKNASTGLYDFPQAQYEYIVKTAQIEDMPPKYSQCDKAQVKFIGEELQKDFYRHTNKYLLENNHGFQFEMKEKTPEEMAMREKYKSDCNKRKADREYNLANKLAEENKEKIKLGKELDQKNEIKEKNLERLEEQEAQAESRMEKIRIKLKKFTNQASDYIKSLFKNDDVESIKKANVAAQSYVENQDLDNGEFTQVLNKAKAMEKQVNKNHLDDALKNFIKKTNGENSESGTIDEIDFQDSKNTNFKNK